VTVLAWLNQKIEQRMKARHAKRTDLVFPAPMGGVNAQDLPSFFSFFDLNPSVFGNPETLGFTITYKAAGTAKVRGSHTRDITLCWPVGSEIFAGTNTYLPCGSPKLQPSVNQ
jgi:hypothetical protein